MSNNDLMASLEEVALGFLHRHQGEHLREQDLFTRTVEHLQTTMKAQQATAESVVARAYGRLRHADSKIFLDVSESTGEMAILVDTRTGKNYAVPVSYIFNALITDPKRKWQH